MPKLSNTTYELIKWLISIVLPAFIVLLATVGTSLQWEYTQITKDILTAFELFLGSIFLKSNIDYNKENNL